MQPRVRWFKGPSGEAFQFLCKSRGIHGPTLANKVQLKGGSLELNEVLVVFDEESGYMSLEEAADVIKERGVSEADPIPVSGQPADQHSVVPPKEATTLKTLPSRWRQAHTLQDVIEPTWLDASAGVCGQQYQKYKIDNTGTLQSLGRTLKTQLCHHEPDPNGSCKTIGDSYLAIAQHFKTEAGVAASRLTLGCAIDRLAVTSGKETRSNVLLYITRDGVQIDKYTYDQALITVAEVKTVDCTADAKNDGLGQVLQKANVALTARQLQRFRLAASVHVGNSLQSVLVVANSSGNTANTAVCTGLLELGTRPRNGVSSIDVDSRAWWEMVWQVYHGLWDHADMKLKAQAQSLQQVLPPDAELLVQMDICSDSTHMDCGDSLQCCISGAFHGVLAGTVQIDCGSTQHVLIKVGQDPGIRALAVHLGQQWEAWYQVERELAVRGALTKLPRNLARLVVAGTVVGPHCSRRVSSSSAATTDGSEDPPSSTAHSSSSNPVASSQVSISNTLQVADSSDSLGLVGRRVLMLERAGVPLVRDGVLPNLALPEAMHLLNCLLMLVVDLLDGGIYWNDCRPSNIGIAPCAPLYQRYYGFDLGAASSKAVDVWASTTIYPGERRKLLPSEYSPVADLAYSSTQAIRGEWLDSSCDLQSAVFTTYVLAGNVLPWQAAADAGDVPAVLQARMLAAADPAMLPGLAAWPYDEQQLAYAAMRGEERAVSIARRIVASR